jgi:hypothetical protein
MCFSITWNSTVCELQSGDNNQAQQYFLRMVWQSIMKSWTLMPDGQHFDQYQQNKQSLHT